MGDKPRAADDPRFAHVEYDQAHTHMRERMALVDGLLRAGSYTREAHVNALNTQRAERKGGVRWM